MGPMRATLGVRYERFAQWAVTTEFQRASVDKGTVREDDLVTVARALAGDGSDVSTNRAAFLYRFAETHEFLAGTQLHRLDDVGTVSPRRRVARVAQLVLHNVRNGR